VRIIERLHILHRFCNPTCVSPQCRRGQCTLVLPPQVALTIDCDKCHSFPQGQRKPDFIVLYVGSTPSRSCWVIVEMKRSVAHPQRIVEQLQTGANVVQQGSHFKIPRSPQNLIALLLHDKHIRTADFARRHITFRGRPTSILHKRCGIRLEDHLA